MITCRRRGGLLVFRANYSVGDGGQVHLREPYKETSGVTAVNCYTDVPCNAGSVLAR